MNAEEAGSDRIGSSHVVELGHHTVRRGGGLGGGSTYTRINNFFPKTFVIHHFNEANIDNIPITRLEHMALNIVLLIPYITPYPVSRSREREKEGFLSNQDHPVTYPIQRYVFCETKQCRAGRCKRCIASQ